MIVYLFIIVTVLVTLMIAVSMSSDGDLPWTCPGCYTGWDQDAYGQYEPWHVSIGTGCVQCRWCGRQYKQGPNGTLVKEPWS